MDLTWHDAISAVFALLCYLLAQKDDRQEKEIAAIKSECKERDDRQAADILKAKAETRETTDLLFTKHDHDEAELNSVKLLLAGEHYKRGELDVKFEKLESTFKEGIRELVAANHSLADKFEILSGVLVTALVDKDFKK